MLEVSLFNDVEARRLPLPRRAGHEGIGVALKVGKDVESVREGDCVVYDEWADITNIKGSRCVKFSSLPKDPAFYVAEPAACVVGALYAYNIMPGDRVLVLGAGYMGLLNVQGLAACPLSELVVTDIKETNLKLAEALGATKVKNVSTPEGRALLKEYEKRPFDLVVEAAGAEETLQIAGSLTRGGGRIGVFAWHHAPRTIDFGEWHWQGCTVFNAAPGISTDRSVSTMERSVRLLERGTFDQKSLITHRHPLARVQEALELATARPEGYIKGVLEFG